MSDSAKIVIILDNASFHKRQDILKEIEAEMPNIILEFLPLYSPDYNLIELVWYSAKEYIVHSYLSQFEFSKDMSLLTSLLRIDLGADLFSIPDNHLGGGRVGEVYLAHPP